MKRTIDTLNIAGLLTVMLWMLLAAGVIAGFAGRQDLPSSPQTTELGESISCQGMPTC